MKFLYLGKATYLITPFDSENKTATLISSFTPTLSPKDPNFPAWWEQHKAEWEEPKNGGQEPADDLIE